MDNKLDSLDLKIVHILQENSRVSITALAKKLSISRPTVTSRLKRLVDEELVNIQGGLNLSKLGLKVANVGLEIRTDKNRREIINVLKLCPRVLNIFRTPEKANIYVTVWGEDDKTISSTVESFGDLPEVDIVYTQFLGTPVHGSFKINVEPNKNDKTPCGTVCGDCYRYNSEWCLGCPITFDYKDPLIKEK